MFRCRDFERHLSFLLIVITVTACRISGLKPERDLWSQASILSSEQKRVFPVVDVIMALIPDFNKYTTDHSMSADTRSRSMCRHVDNGNGDKVHKNRHGCAKGLRKPHDVRHARALRHRVAASGKYLRQAGDHVNQVSTAQHVASRS